MLFHLWISCHVIHGRLSLRVGRDNIFLIKQDHVNVEIMTSKYPWFSSAHILIRCQKASQVHRWISHIQPFLKEQRAGYDTTWEVIGVDCAKQTEFCYKEMVCKLIKVQVVSVTCLSIKKMDWWYYINYLNLSPLVWWTRHNVFIHINSFTKNYENIGPFLAFLELVRTIVLVSYMKVHFIYEKCKCDNVTSGPSYLSKCLIRLTCLYIIVTLTIFHMLYSRETAVCQP